MKTWKRALGQEVFPLSLQPVLWTTTDSKEITNTQPIPNITVTLQIRGIKEEVFSYELVYDIQDVFFIQLEVENTGNEEISRIVVSHMIRDHLVYIPNTLKTNKGTGELLFRLVRWQIDELLPNEKVQLICQVKAVRIPITSHISLRATYTFRYKDLIYGPFQTKEAIATKR